MQDTKLIRHLKQLVLLLRPLAAEAEANGQGVLAERLRATETAYSDWITYLTGAGQISWSEAALSAEDSFPSGA